MANPKPIRVQENPFGDFTEEQLAGQPLADRFFLAGYSDERQRRDALTREAALAGRPAPKFDPMPRRFQYVSVERADKTPVGEKEMEFRRLGYRVVKWEELAALGIDAETSACKRGPDGSVRVGSQMLMVCDAPVAARNFRDQREATERQGEEVKGRLQNAAENYNAKHGHSKGGGTTFDFEEEIIEK